MVQSHVKGSHHYLGWPNGSLQPPLGSPWSNNPSQDTKEGEINAETEEE